MEELRLVAYIAIALTAAFIGGVLARLLKQPVILGYLLVGILAGPYGLGLVQEPGDARALASLGVILLLFAIGLEFSLSELRKLGKIALLGGTMQVLITVGLGIILAFLLGAGFSEALAFGFLFALSSTMIVLKALSERGELNTPHGRVMLGFLLVQDLAVIPMMVTLPLLSGSFGKDVGLSLGLALLKASLFIGGIFLFGAWVAPRLMRLVAGFRSRELFLLCVTALCLGIAYLAHLLGLSPALGAFIAGLAIAQSEFAHQALGNISPLRDVFSSFFFISLGMLFMDPGFIAENLSSLGILIPALLVLKFAVFFLLTRLFGFSRRTAFLTGAGMVQLSEFSFVLGEASVVAGVLSEHLYSLALASAMVTMVLTPFILNLATRFCPFKRERPEPLEGAKISGHVLICGYGRVGRTLAYALERMKVPYLVVELDPQVISSLRASNIPCVYGDAGNHEVLKEAGLEKARVLVLAIPDPLAAREAIEYARESNPQLDILARIHGDEEAEFLRRRGVNELIYPEVEAGLEVIRHTLNRLDFLLDQVESLIESLREEELKY